MRGAFLTHSNKKLHVPQSDDNMHVKNLCEFVKTDLSINIRDFYLCGPAFHTLHVMNGAIKIYAVQIYATSA